MMHPGVEHVVDIALVLALSLDLLFVGRFFHDLQIIVLDVVGHLCPEDAQQVAHALLLCIVNQHQKC